MRNDVTLFDREGLVANPYFALAFENEKHLLVDAMIMKWPSALARGHDGQIIAELLRTDAPSNVADLRGKFLRGIFRARNVRTVADLAKLDIGKIEDGFWHDGSLCCRTIEL